MVITWIVSGSSDLFAGDPLPVSTDQSIVKCGYKKAKNLTTEVVSSRVTKEVDLKSSNQRSALWLRPDDGNGGKNIA